MLISIALILLGLALVAVEVYVTPGLSVVGIAGGISIVAGVVLAFVEGGTLGGLVASVGSVTLAGGMFYAMWQSGALQQFVLLDSLISEPKTEAGSAEARSKFLGSEGVAVTPLRPGGVVEIDGERVEVQTEGGFIASGSTVRVVAMDRRRFFVRLAEESEVNEEA